jgi:hypothetical protein
LCIYVAVDFSKSDVSESLLLTFQEGNIGNMIISKKINGKHSKIG